MARFPIDSRDPRRLDALPVAHEILAAERREPIDLAVFRVMEGCEDHGDRPLVHDGTSAVKQSPRAANAQAETNTLGITRGKYPSSSWIRPRTPEPSRESPARRGEPAE